LHAIRARSRARKKVRGFKKKEKKKKKDHHRRRLKRKEKEEQKKNEQSKHFKKRFENLLLFRAVFAGVERAIGSGSNRETVYFLPNLWRIGDEAAADGRTHAECYHSRKPDLPEGSAEDFGHDAFKRGHDCLGKHSRGDHGGWIILGEWK
jgi:hypothetical protein